MVNEPSAIVSISVAVVLKLIEHLHMQAYKKVQQKFAIADSLSYRLF